MTWQARAYRLPLATPYRWAHGEQTERHGVLVTDGNGWGECALPPHEDASGLLRQVQATQDWDAASPRIRCGFATARWDGQARDADTTLAALLAEHHGLRARERVEVNALITAPMDGLAAEVDAAVAAGFRTLKVKMGRPDDLDRLAVVRDHASGCRLRLDPNGVWQNPQAMLDAVAGPDIEYVEDPCATPMPLDGPVAADAWADQAGLERVLDERLASHVVLKPQRLGGPDRALEAYLRCRDQGTSCTITNSLESSVGLHAALHVAALVPGVHGLATARYFAKDVAPAPRMDGPYMVVQGPGSGVHLA